MSMIPVPPSGGRWSYDPATGTFTPLAEDGAAPEAPREAPEAPAPKERKPK